MRALQDEVRDIVERDGLILRRHHPELCLVVEIDGRLHEDDPGAFENDCWRQNALVLQGWAVLRFTWVMLRDHPDVVLGDVQAAIAARRR